MPTEAVATRVEAVPGVPAQFGLPSVWTLVPTVDPHELAGVRWQPLSCAGAYVTPWCPGDIDEPYPKDFDSPEVVYAPPVTVYAGDVCSPIGSSRDEAVARARTALMLGEPRALEEWVWANLLAAGAQDVTPATGAVGLAAGIGLVEGELGNLYGGIGVVHLPLSIMTPAGAAGALIQRGQRMVTWAGNLVAGGAGYYLNTGPDGEEAPAGEAWVYASGPVVVRRQDPPDVIPDADNESIDITYNDRYVLAERTTVVGVECAIVATRVEVTCS